MNISEYGLNEGIRFYKTSNRIKRLSNKIVHKIELSSVGKNKDVVMRVVHKLDDMAEEFRKIEEKYSIEVSKSKRHEIQAEYYSLEEKYSSLLSLLNESRMISIIKGFGISSIIAAIFFIMFSFFHSSGFGAEVVSLKNYNPTGDSIVGSALKNLGSDESKVRGKIFLDIAGNKLGVAGGVPKLERGSSWLDMKSSLGNREKFSIEEKNVSLVSSSYVSLGVAGILKLFLKLFINKKETTYLYNKTVSILEKL